MYFLFKIENMIQSLILTLPAQKREKKWLAANYDYFRPFFVVWFYIFLLQKPPRNLNVIYDLKPFESFAKTEFCEF